MKIICRECKAEMEEYQGFGIGEAVTILIRCSQHPEHAFGSVTIQYPVS